MYNLFVSADDEAWSGTAFDIELSRCVREYTVENIADTYKHLAKSDREEIIGFPCIFAYEKTCRKDPKFGFIREIIKRTDKVRIDYEIVELKGFLTAQQLIEMEFELDIGKLELNRTHWAIKDVNLSKELYKKGIKIPTGIDSEFVDITKHFFQVALSFPGEVRSYVEKVIGELEHSIGGDSYFYDNKYKSQLARPSLDTLLQDIYRNRSKLIVVFFGQKYQEKKWCGIEFRAIKDIIAEKEHSKVMLVKMDDGKVDGVLSIDGYIDGRTYAPEEVAKFILERVRLS